MRLDKALVDRGFFTGRARACEAISGGRVLVNRKHALKPALDIHETDAVCVVPAADFVSRGGQKLERAMTAFGITVDGLVCADVGASAGGFTDCLLRRGAKKVYAIDAGRDQLSPALRRDSRVVSMEGRNIRGITAGDFVEPPSFFTVDVSFISLRLVLPVLRALGMDAGIALVKPQFEAGRAALSKRGVVRDALIHETVLTAFCENARLNGYGVAGLIPSPVRGPEGNIEFLAHLSDRDAPADIKAVVRQAHNAPAHEE